MDLQILSQLLQMSYKSTEGFQNRWNHNPVFAGMPKQNVFMRRSCHFVFVQDVVRGKCLERKSNFLQWKHERKKTRLCFHYDISVFFNFMKSDCWVIYYKLAVPAWKSRPKSFYKCINMLERQESNGNLITSCNWGIINFLIQSVLVFNEFLIWKTNTAKQNPIIPKLLMRCNFSLGHACHFSHSHLWMTEILCLLFTIKCS